MTDIDDRELDAAMKQVRGTWRPWLLLVLTIAIAGWGGYQLHRQRTDAEKEVTTIDARIAEKVSEVAVLEQAKAELATRIERVTAENVSLAALKARDEEERERAARARARLERLQLQLAEKVPKDPKLRIEVKDAVEIRLPGELVFDRAAVSAKGQTLLVSVGEVLSSTTGLEVEIAADSDDRAAPWETSAARAAAVARVLAEKGRVDAARMRAIARGHAKDPALEIRAAIAEDKAP